MEKRGMSKRFSTARAVMRFAAITILAGLSCHNDQPLGPKPLASLIVSSAQTTSQAPLPVTIVTVNEAGVELEGEVEAARAVLCLAGRDLSCATPLATVIEEGARLQLHAQVGGGYSRSLVRDVTVGPVHEGRTYHVGLDDRTTTVTTTPGTTRIEIVFAAAVVTIATVSQSGVDISGHISITSPEG